MRTIVWGNYKGGVGKTTSTYQVAMFFASYGKRVLLLDLDPQCSLSHICCNGVRSFMHEDISLESFDADKTFNYLLDIYTRLIRKNNDIDLELLKKDTYDTGLDGIVDSCIKKIKDGVCFIPSSISFNGCRINDMARKMEKFPQSIFLMKLLINDIAIREQFDYVFIDCPPTNNQLIESAFLSSDYYIVPTIIDEISANGVPDYISQIEKTYYKYDSTDEIGSILMNKVFMQKTKLIGVVETLYKERRGNRDNTDQVIALNRNIQSLQVDSLLSLDQNEKYRVFSETEHIFKNFIPHRDNRTAGESVPARTSQGTIANTYYDVAKDIYDVLNKK